MENGVVSRLLVEREKVAREEGNCKWINGQTKRGWEGVCET